MRIVADENIPLVDEFFSRFGDIHRCAGRAIDHETLVDADVLLVRSVTRVDRALLEGSRVRFVGTCTIGTDHLDLDYFHEAGIAWSSAPGCNARGVVDYVLGCLLAMAESSGAALAQRTYGIVGAGQVGGRLAKVLQGLGWNVKVCDPPRQEAENGDFVSLQEILLGCDVISLHTPLDASTRHLISTRELLSIQPGSWLINASRGAVIDNHALHEHLAAGANLRVALDVWEGEPMADPNLASYCQITTPHIAGYSLEGKLRGTAQIHSAFCQTTGQAETVSLADLLPPTWLSTLTLHENTPTTWALSTLCRSVYDPRADDADFRRALIGDDVQRRAAFDALRKHYPARREIDGLAVHIEGNAAELQQLVLALGARLV